MPENKKIIIAAGGTGGHLYPGVVLARELKLRGADPFFIIRKDDPAKAILQKEKIYSYEIPVRAMPRKISIQIFAFAFYLIRSFFIVLKFLNITRPAVVVGMGGYISFPVVFMAALRGVPTLIHEQNYIPGFANRILSLVANTTAVSFDDTLKRFNRKKTVLTGNPVRPELFDVEPSTAYSALGLDPSIFTLLVFGGSLGASGLNRIIAESLPYLGNYAGRVQFIHICGAKDAGWVGNEYNNKGFNAKVFAYLHDMGIALAAADLVISRSGATTVAELTLLKKKAILVPYPHAAADHQWYNAQLLAKSGHADVIREGDLTPAYIAERIVSGISSFNPNKSKIQPPSPFPQQLLADAVFKIIS